MNLLEKIIYKIRYKLALIEIKSYIKIKKQAFLITICILHFANWPQKKKVYLGNLGQIQFII